MNYDDKDAESKVLDCCHDFAQIANSRQYISTISTRASIYQNYNKWSELSISDNLREIQFSIDEEHDYWDSPKKSSTSELIDHFRIALDILIKFVE